MAQGFKILFFGFLFATCAFSQSIYFNRLTTENGLSNNNVFDILQDKYGFLWFATDDGLNRFDGYDFKIFRNDPANENSISDNSVWTLTEDKKGNIWLGTKNGCLNRFDPLTEKFTKWKIKTDEVKENAITCIYEDSKGKIWIGTYRQGLYRLDINSGVLDHWYNKPGDKTSLSNDYISSIKEDSQGNFWISTYFGLNKFNPESHPHKFEHFIRSSDDNNSLGGNIIWKLTQSPSDKNIIWVGTNNGLSMLQMDSETFSRIKIPNPENFQFGTSVAAVIEEISDGQKILWIESYGGLIRYDLNGNNYMRFTADKNNPQSLSSNEVHRILRDNSGVLWIATDKGLNYLSDKSTKFNNPFSDKFRIDNSSELDKKNIKAIIITYDNVIYFGTEEGLYYSIQKNGKIAISKFKKTEKLNVWSLTSDLSGNLWIGTYGSGLFKINLKNGSLQNIPMFSEWTNTQSIKFNKAVLCDNQNKIWIGYWGFGLARLDPITGKYKGWLNDPEDSLSLSYEDVWAIHQDKKGRIWIGTDGGGLNLFVEEDGGKFLRWTAEDSGSINSNSIYSICESNYSQNIKDTEVVLWLGTNNGLNKFTVKNSSQEKNVLTKPDVEIIHYGIEHGLSDNSIKSLIEDEKGNLWIGTSSGISFFDTQQNKFTNFSKADGVIGNDINLSSSARNKDGVIFMGSTEGLNYFYPSDIHRSEFKPTILITDFQIFNESVLIGEDSPLKQSILLTKEIILSYTQNVFSFQFAALDYTSPRSIQYSYMMEGFDNDWTHSGSRRYATYTNLSPGEYIFKIKSTNSDKVWMDNISEVKVIVTPPWWQTPWAIGLYALIFVLGVWGIIKFQEYRARLQHELKMQEFEAHHLREIEKMKSRFFANLSHEFRTPLTLIKGPLEQLISGRIKDNLIDYYKMLLRNTEKLQSLIDQLLELSQLEAETIPLNIESLDLVSLLRSFTYNFMPLAEEKFITLEFNTSVESFTAMIDRDKLEKIINNLLSNAFKFTPSGGRISVNLKQENSLTNNFALVEVSDTGSGIPEEYQSKIFDRFYQVDGSSKRNESGSGIGLALVKELVSLHNWDISVNSKVGEGTTFTVKIPAPSPTFPKSGREVESLNNPESADQKKEEFSALAENESEDSIEKEEKPFILFVEDSTDVRSYVNDLLKPDYKVLLAENAEEGIELALKNLPDLIISDLMMPGMDGIEFCNKIKSDWQTSHIPFILLTAKVTDESKIEGLETGADDYLTKPFNYDELAARIKNLIEQRKRLREKFSKEINIQPDSITSSKVDSEFLEKAITITQKNISNENFDTEKLAEEMFVSRRQLHRKLQAITGQGPGEFIRTFRLKRAAQLLLENKLSVTQIALEVGFESPAQFTRSFKKHFNVLPSDFIQQIYKQLNPTS